MTERTDSTPNGRREGVPRRRLWATLIQLEAAALELDTALAGAALIADMAGAEADVARAPERADALAATLERARVAAREIESRAARALVFVGPVAGEGRNHV